MAIVGFSGIIVSHQHPTKQKIERLRTPTTDHRQRDVSGNRKDTVQNSGLYETSVVKTITACTISIIAL